MVQKYRECLFDHGIEIGTQANKNLGIQVQTTTKKKKNYAQRVHPITLI